MKIDFFNKKKTFRFIRIFILLLIKFYHQNQCKKLKNRIKVLLSKIILLILSLKTQLSLRLLSSLDIFSQNIKTDETFIENNLAVSIINLPNNRTKPIIGFAFGKTIQSKQGFPNEGLLGP